MMRSLLSEAEKKEIREKTTEEVTADVTQKVTADVTVKNFAVCVLNLMKKKNMSIEDILICTQKSGHIE